MTNIRYTIEEEKAYTALLKLRNELIKLGESANLYYFFHDMPESTIRGRASEENGFVRIIKDGKYTNDIFFVDTTYSGKDRSCRLKTDKLKFYSDEIIPVILTLYHRPSDACYIKSARQHFNGLDEKQINQKSVIIPYSDDDLLTNETLFHILDVDKGFQRVV
jgi:hypothetical protein